MYIPKILGLPMLLIFASCSPADEINILSNDNIAAITQGDSNHYTITEIDSIAKSIVGGCGERSRNTATSHIYPYSIFKSRGGDSDTVFFIANLAPEGYAVIAADRRLAQPVYGFSKQGKFDDSNNPALQFYMQILVEDVAAELEHLENGDVPISSTSGSGPLIPIPDPGTDLPMVEDVDGVMCNVYFYVDTVAVEPMLVTSWNQGSPYNAYINKVYGGTNMYTGCVATAIAQLLGYHRHPKEMNGHVYDWDAMLADKTANKLTQKGKDCVAYLMYDLGTESLLNLTYIDGESPSVDEGPTKDALKKLGFTHLISTSSWSDNILSSLRNDGPELILGKSSTKGAHAWVIDGYQKITHRMEYYRMDDGSHYTTRGYVDTYLHMIWGGNGVRDGYYKQASHYEEYDEKIKYIYNLYL